MHWAVMIFTSPGGAPSTKEETIALLDAMAAFCKWYTGYQVCCAPLSTQSCSGRRLVLGNSGQPSLIESRDAGQRAGTQADMSQTGRQDQGCCLPSEHFARQSFIDG